jgi:hypothetical protein
VPVRIFAAAEAKGARAMKAKQFSLQRDLTNHDLCLLHGHGDRAPETLATDNPESILGRPVSRPECESGHNRGN